MIQEPSTDKSRDMKITVDELIEAPFSTRSLEDQKKIVSDGRPTPPLDISIAILSGTAIKCTRKSDTKLQFRRNMGRSAFDEFQWLTCTVTPFKLHCWPCLLFHYPGKIVLNKDDIFLDLSYFKEHEKSAEHIEAMFRLQIFVNQNLKATAVETVGMNREALRRLVDVVCSFVALQKIPETDSCLKTVVFLRKYDAVNKRHSSDAIKLLKECPGIVDRIVKAIVKVLRRSVFKAVQSSQYVSLILGRHSDEKISSILRYVRNGKVEERFLGFSCVFDSAYVYEHVKKLVDELDIGSKCVALSLGAGLLDPADWDMLFTKLKTDAPLCIFSPWHSHPVDFVWQHSLSATDPKCKKFFKCMSAMEGYFHDSNELCAALDDFAPEIGIRDVLSCGPTTDFLSCVQRNRLHLAEFFDSTLSDVTRWDADHIAKAVGCREFLRDETTAFLLNVFVRMSRLFAPLRTALGGYVPERRFSEGIVSDLLLELHLVQDQDCKTLLASQVLSPEENSYIQLFDNIMERVIAEVGARYGDLEKFQFCCLFDFLEEEWYQESNKHLQYLKKFYDLNFNDRQAQSELAVLERHGAFSKTSVYDFHQHLHDSHLKHTFKSLFDFSELVLVMPFKHTSLERETSLWDKIVKWSVGPRFSEALDDLYFLFVETDYLLEIKQLPDFYDEVCADL